MLPRARAEGTGQGHRDSNCISRKGLDGSACSASKVKPYQAESSGRSICGPETDGHIDVSHLIKVAELNVLEEANEGKYCESDMKDLENLIKSMSERAPSLDSKEDKRHGCLPRKLVSSSMDND
jgi:hypothetical protein